MAHTYAIHLEHCIFSTKNRLPLIVEPEKAWRTLRMVAREASLRVLAVGGTENHVHILVEIPKTQTVSDVVRELKANSSRLLRQNWRLFGWQDGYGSISVSPSAIESVTRYIARQAEHHSRRSFEEEYVEILARAGVKYEPKYVFD
jgi:REP element-mobilizing transposase RayT